MIPSTLFSLKIIWLFGYFYVSIRASLVAQLVKSAVQETRVPSLGWEDPLEKEMATHSSSLAWKISQTQEPGGLQSMGSQRVGTTERLTLHVLIQILELFVLVL